MMKHKYKLIVSFALIATIIATIFIFFNKNQLETAYSKLNEVFKSIGEKNLTQFKPPSFQPSGEENKTNATNYTGAPLPGGAGQQGSNASETASKALTLEIIDICSGKFGEFFSLSEGGVRSCLNQKYPYYIVLEKNSTHLQTSFNNVVGFNETYEINESVLIFFIFAEDVASVSKVIQSFYIEGNPDFYLGDYDLHTIWERDASGNLYISKMIVALPLYVRSTVPTTNEWNELKFYLSIPNKNYYLGNLWVLVKEK